MQKFPSGLFHRQPKPEFREHHYPASSLEDSFLPDFCSIRWVLPIILVAQLLAFMLVLSCASRDFWLDLGLVSLFIQWIAVSSAALLCGLRGYLNRFSDWVAGGFSYGLLVFTVLFWSQAAVYLSEYWGLETFMVHPAGFTLRNGLISLIVYGILLHYLYLLAQWKRQVRAEANARFQALQARIRPHFLFNSLNTAANWVHTDPARAETIIEDLADLFRMSLRDAQHRVTLGDELRLVENYLYIEQARLGARLQVDWQLDPILPLSMPLPALILQPLVENAVYHGIEPQIAGGTIQIQGYLQENILKICIVNPLPPPGGVASHVSHEGHHLAMDNIGQRLALLYPHIPAHRLLTHTRTEQYYQVTLSLPVIR